MDCEEDTMVDFKTHFTLSLRLSPKIDLTPQMLRNLLMLMNQFKRSIALHRNKHFIIYRIIVNYKNY